MALAKIEIAGCKLLYGRRTRSSRALDILCIFMTYRAQIWVSLRTVSARVPTFESVGCQDLNASGLVLLGTGPYRLRP